MSVGRFDLQRLSQMLPGARVPRFLPIVPKGTAASLQAEETLADLLKKRRKRTAGLWFWRECATRRPRIGNGGVANQCRSATF